MFDDLLAIVRTEAVKLQLQISVPVPDQKNDVLKNIFIEDFDPQMLMHCVKRNIGLLEEVTTVEELKELKDNFNRKRTEIQYEGYGYGDMGRKRAAEAYSYVFLLRIFRQQKI